MKNYKVIATRFFKDSNEIDEKTGLKIERQVNDEFYCTKERYEFLKANSAVRLVEIVEEPKKEIKEDTKVVCEDKEVEKLFEEPKIEIEENGIKINSRELKLIVENEEAITINKEEVKPKPKKKKSSKK